MQAAAHSETRLWRLGGQGPHCGSVELTNFMTILWRR